MKALDTLRCLNDDDSSHNYSYLENQMKRLANQFSRGNLLPMPPANRDSISPNSNIKAPDNSPTKTQKAFKLPLIPILKENTGVSEGSQSATHRLLNGAMSNRENIKTEHTIFSQFKEEKQDLKITDNQPMFIPPPVSQTEKACLKTERLRKTLEEKINSLKSFTLPKDLLGTLLDDDGLNLSNNNNNNVIQGNLNDVNNKDDPKRKLFFRMTNSESRKGSREPSKEQEKSSSENKIIKTENIVLNVKRIK